MNISGFHFVDRQRNKNMNNETAGKYLFHVTSLLKLVIVLLLIILQFLPFLLSGFHIVMFLNYLDFPIRKS